MRTGRAASPHRLQNQSSSSCRRGFPALPRPAATWAPPPHRPRLTHPPLAGLLGPAPGHIGGGWAGRSTPQAPAEDGCSGCSCAAAVSCGCSTGRGWPLGCGLGGQGADGRAKPGSRPSLLPTSGSTAFPGTYFYPWEEDSGSQHGAVTMGAWAADRAAELRFTDAPQKPQASTGCRENRARAGGLLTDGAAGHAGQDAKRGRAVDRATRVSQQHLVSAG